MIYWAAFAATLLVAVVRVGHADEAFLEKFALAEDREVVLEELIPGTEEYYYYHCLHYQNAGQLDKVDQLLEPWIERHKRTSRVREIQNRQALFHYGTDPEAMLQYASQELGLHFNHQRQVVGEKPHLPTSLDPALISRATLTKQALERSQYRETVAGFEDSALDWLIAMPLDAKRRRDLLQRLQRPDHPNLVQLIAEDLDAEHSRGFGSIEIHRKLLLNQLEDLLRLIPDLLNTAEFVNVYLTNLQPSADVDWPRDAAAREAYLDRLEAFVTRLNASHNSLKAHVLHHRLVHDRGQAMYDKARFMNYIQLPRDAVYMKRDYVQRRDVRPFAANLGQDFQKQTRLPVIGTDEPLVRSYLQHFFVEEDSYEPYAAYLDDNYLKEIFAETKILHGLGDMEQWYSWLAPAKYRALKERVDLDFDYANKSLFAMDEPVRLALWAKNVDTLIVKVFEINTENYYRRYQRQVNTDIDLDGLVANEESVYTYDEPPLRRVKKEFEFPSLTGRGVWVIEFIGNGKSSRALIRKGRLHYLVRTSTAGHVLAVLDESKRKLEGAAIWLGGHEYRADEDGTITAPFTNKPGRQPIVLSHGGFAYLDHFAHESEEYSLVAGIHVDRESLRRERQAQVAIRPALYLNGTPVTLSVLEEPRLVVTSVDREGISTTQEAPAFKLFEDRMSLHDFQVPDDLASISFTLRAKIQKLTRTDKVDLAASESFRLNQVDTTDKIEVLHLSRIGGQYVLELLGKSGEPKADRPVYVVVKHRDFKDEVHPALQTDAEGRIQLGTLDDIEWVKATGPDEVERMWPLTQDRHNYPMNVNGAAGEPIRIAYMGQEAEPVRSEFSLLERRGWTYVADRFTALRIEGGFVTISGLPAGDYELYLKPTGTRINIRLAAGAEKERYALSDYRHLEVMHKRPLQIVDIEVEDEAVSVRLGNASEFSRVHVVATRFVPAYSFYDGMGVVRLPEPLIRAVPWAESVYVSGRNIGDEYRYILDRKYAKKFPGNMLERPGLLISPWAISKTEAGRQEAAPGEPPPPAPAPSEAKAERGEEAAAEETGNVDYANLDFLSGDPVVLLNLAPDESGVVTIPREGLRGRQHLHIVAIDPANTVYRQVSLTEGDIPFLDLRLAKGLDPEQHVAEQKQITVVRTGQEFVLEDVTTSRFEVYDTLEKVYRLYVTLSGDPTLIEFGFITRWPELKDDEKRELFSKYACHELSFFLSKKDPEFFEAVVRPFLDNKRDKTFLDEWLLGKDLHGYLKPWSHGQLNIVERVLLGQRIEGEQMQTARHVTDLYNLLPPDVERSNYLFMTALRGRALEVLAGDLAEQLHALGYIGDAYRRAGEVRAKGAPALAEGERARDEMAVGEVAAVKRAGLIELDETQGIKALRTAVETAEETFIADINGDFFARDAKRRERVRRFYQALDKTEEWAENNYYHLPIEAQNASLITVNAFWRDYADRDPDTPFLSANVAKASRNFPEMMFALAVLDLPFEADEHETSLEQGRYAVKTASPMIVFHKKIRETEAESETTPVLVSQNFFRHGDRYRYVDNERVDKFVADEFLAQVVYGCQVAVTNPSSSRRKLDVLLQAPQGAIPVSNGKYTRSVSLDLEPYNTTAIEYYFYFPEPGEYPHYPVHVAKDGDLIAYAGPTPMNVVLTPSTVDTTSWDYVSQDGAEEDVLAFLNEHNLHRINLDRIVWRMRDKGSFDAVTSLLERRHVYNHTLWSYAIYHKDVPGIRQFLQHIDGIEGECGAYIDTELLTIDPVIRKIYQHLEYSPLVNARAHQLGPTRRILNDRLAEQYRRLTTVLAYRPELDNDDLMAVTYYLLLQGRVDEAVPFFKRVDRDTLATQLQYDYLAAYVAFYREDLDTTRTIAAKYEDYPVDRWRKRFAEVRSQLAEIEGAAAAVIDKGSHIQRQTQLASTEPNFEFKVEGKRISVDYQNLTECRVNYYLMDVELLFSRSPFVQQHSDHFSTIRPNFSETVALPAASVSHRFDLPEQFHSSNVLIEIEAGGVRKSQAYYANNLVVHFIENYGQLKVTHRDTGRPLSKVYVKVFARMKDGQVRFYKDGYADLRGRFDYVSLNTNELDFVEKFAVLVLSDVDGAVVREANPPKT